MNSFLEIASYLHGQANSVGFWTTCLKDCPSILLAIIQKFFLSDSILPGVNLYSVNIAVDEVKRVASSLISEALSHARMSLDLRKILLGRKFIYSKHKFAEPVHLAVGNQLNTVCLEIIESMAIELCPDVSESIGFDKYVLTPWSVLRCYLESILQVGMINESLGNRAGAEVLFLTGKGISSEQDLPIFQITFTSLLGQLYRKSQFLDSADNALTSARDLLRENETIISCKQCKLGLNVLIAMQFGDLYRNRREGDSIQSSSFALQLYRKALGKLNAELANSLNRRRKAETCRVKMQDVHYDALNSGKIPSTEGEVRLPPCNSCSSNGNSTDSGLKKECKYNTIKCWRCFLVEAMTGGTMQNIIYLKWECHCRRLGMRLLLKIAKCQGIHCGKNNAHDVPEQFCQCISIMFDQHPTSRGSSVVRDFYLIELNREDSREIFPVEKALLLYNMSWFFLKDRSENSRMNCCILWNIQTSDVAPWLLRAFVLSRELPLLFQKVSKLLSSIYLAPTVGDLISVPCSSQSVLSTSHWAAFFHQASVGTYVPCQYLACLEDPSSIKLDAIIKASNFLRFAPDRLEHLEEFVGEFFQNLPSVPIICISFLEGDYANLIRENLHLSSWTPAWMLLSRLNAGSQPITILLPVDHILDGVQLESVEKWQCPWSYSVVDHVVPVFKQLLSNIPSSCINKDWWKRRRRHDECLEKFVKSMEDSWLGPWSCLLLGELSNPNNQSEIIAKLIDELKLRCEVEPNDSLVSAILGGSKSIAEMEACISQLVSYRGYFGGEQLWTKVT